MAIHVFLPSISVMHIRGEGWPHPKDGRVIFGLGTTPIWSRHYPTNLTTGPSGSEAWPLFWSNLLPFALLGYSTWQVSCESLREMHAAQLNVRSRFMSRSFVLFWAEPEALSIAGGQDDALGRKSRSSRPNRSSIRHAAPVHGLLQVEER